MTEDKFTVKVEGRRQEPLKIVPKEKLENSLQLLQEEEEFAAKLIFRLGNTNIFRLKWQDVEETEDGWKIQLKDETATLQEEDITSELKKRKEENRPLLNTTAEKLEEQLPEEVRSNHLRHGGMLHLLQGDCRLLEIHKRSGYAPATIRKLSKQFKLSGLEDVEIDFHGEEYSELERYLLENGELTVLKGEDRPEKVLPEEKLDDLVDRIHDKRYAMATRLLFRGGLRLSECLELTWEDLEQEDGYWEAEINTGRADRTVILRGEKLDQLLEEFQKDEGEVFDFSKTALANKLNEVSDGDISPNTLRISRAYDLANKRELNQETLRYFFGWKTRKTARKYFEAAEVQGVME